MKPRILHCVILSALAACSTTRHTPPFGIGSGAILGGGGEAPVAAPLTTAQGPGTAPVPRPPSQAPAPRGQAQPQKRTSTSRWRDRETLLQGFFGANSYETVERSGGGRPTVDGSGEELAQTPVIGGGAQWKLAGERIDLGVEGMLSFSWRSDATAIAVGGGGAAVAVDVDLFVFELYGGPFASMFLGDNLRLYGSAGPLMQWASYEEESVFDDGSSSGFGLGWYARTGIEFMVGTGSMLGFGVRWSDSQVDLGSDGDLDLEGFQVGLTYSYFY